jgi:hypothetical protein
VNWGDGERKVGREGLSRARGGGARGVDGGLGVLLVVRTVADGWGRGKRVGGLHMIPFCCIRHGVLVSTHCSRGMYRSTWDV